MPNLSNYVNNFLKFMFVISIISDKIGLNLFIFGTVINHNMNLMYLKYTLALCQNVAFIFIIS